MDHNGFGYIELEHTLRNTTMAGRINTSAVLNNSYFTGNEQPQFTRPIAIDPTLEKQYDYQMTEDPVLLQERKETMETLYDIFKESPYFEKYGVIPGTQIPQCSKVEKGDIVKLFYYFKEELDKRRDLSAFETVIAINEFFDLNYEYVVENVLSVPIKAEILEDYHDNLGMGEYMENVDPLF